MTTNPFANNDPGPGRADRVMTRLRYGLLPLLLLLLLAAAPLARAQEGHPLVGTWQGSWGENDALLTIIMSWDGRRISGIVNPGPGATDIESASLDSSRWHVELETPLVDDTGTSATLRLEGQINDVTSRTRSIDATWRYRGDSGSITLTRQGGA